MVSEGLELGRESAETLHEILCFNVGYYEGYYFKGFDVCSLVEIQFSSKILAQFYQTMCYHILDNNTLPRIFFRIDSNRISS
jgi:hypothetical protein